MEKETKASIAEYWILRMWTLCMLCCQIVFTVLFCNGVVSLFGRTVKISVAIRMSLAIFDMNGAYYRAILSSIVGIGYIIILCGLVKKICTAGIYVKNAFCKKSCDAIYLPTSTVCNSFITILAFICVCRIIGSGQPNINAQTLFAVIIPVIFISKALTYWMSNCTVKTIALNMLYLSIYVVLIQLIFLNLEIPALNVLLKDVQYIFTASHSIFDSIVRVCRMINAVAVIFLLGYILKIFGTKVGYSWSRYIETAALYEDAKTILVLSAIPVFTEIIKYAVTIGDITLGAVLSKMVPVAPLLCATIALLITHRFNTEMEYRKPKQSPEEAQTETTENCASPS